MPALNFDLLATRLVPVVCVLAACACATTAAGPSTAQEKPAMTESTPATANDSFNAQQLNDRVLAWILTVNDTRDLSTQSIEKHTGLDLRTDPEDPGRFRAVGALPEAWRFSLSSVKTVSGPSPHAVLLSMGRAGDSYADMTPVCVGLEHYQSALIAAGFKASERPRRGGTEYRLFRTEKVYVRIELHGKTAALDEQLCVSRVFVTAAAPQG